LLRYSVLGLGYKGLILHGPASGGGLRTAAPDRPPPLGSPPAKRSYPGCRGASASADPADNSRCKSARGAGWRTRRRPWRTSSNTAKNATIQSHRDARRDRNRRKERRPRSEEHT